MPSIEIVCIGQRARGDFSHLPFAVESGTELKSHRTPRPLFGEDFASLKGSIYHLGNPDLKRGSKRRLFFAYDLLSDRARSGSRPKFLEFRPEFAPAVRELLESLVHSSPVGELLFTSDWQFGPKRPYRSPVVSLEEFWALHDSRKLRLNGAYRIRDSASTRPGVQRRRAKVPILKSKRPGRMNLTNVEIEDVLT